MSRDPHHPEDDRPASFPRWVHAGLAAIGVLLGFYAVETTAASALVILASVAYAAWAAGRAAGIGLALTAGALPLLETDLRGTEALLLPGLWLTLYLAIALVISAIEAATRPADDAS